MMKRRNRWWHRTVPGLMLVGGVATAAVFGWNYAKQTVLLSQEHLPQYKPAPAQASSQSISLQSNDKSTSTSSVKLWTPMPKNGTQIGTLSFPSIHLTVPIVQGSNPSDLSLGVGHVTSTALPGQGSNVFLAGHRDTVFSRLKELKKGDTIILTTPYGNFIYQATSFEVVPDTDVALLAPTDYETLTLSTCYPFNYFGAAPDRYIVFTKLVQEPKGIPAVHPAT